MGFVKHRLRSASAESVGSVRVSSLYGTEGGGLAESKNLSRADSESYFDNEKAPGAVNMLRHGTDEVCKRPGYRFFEKPKDMGQIQVVWKYKRPDLEEEILMYCRDGLYHFGAGFSVVSRLSIKNIYSVYGSYLDCYSFQGGKYMYFTNLGRMNVLDCVSGELLEYYNQDMCSITEPETVYLPTTYIAGYPDGSATAYQNVNIINPYVAEQYIGDGTSTEYKVHFPLESVYQAYILSDTGEWTETEVASYTEDTVNFASPPPKASVTGEDNVRIVYQLQKTALNFSRVSKCTCGTLFGLGGFEDRLFVSGNDTLPGYIFYSELNEPTYFPENNYIRVGSEGTTVQALAANGVTLYVIANDNIYCVGGVSMSDNENTDYVENAQFSIIDILKTPPAVRHPAVVFDGEITYLTTEGICAVTPSGVLDERCCQIRSSYLNNFLKNERLGNYSMITCENWLILSDRNDTLYLLDGNRYSVTADKPFSTRQYECYVLKGIPAKYMWTHKSYFYFSDGEEIFRFNKDFSSDDGLYGDRKEKDGSLYPVKAYWETPDIYPGRFETKKFFTRAGVLLGEQDESGNFDTDVKVYAKFDNDKWRTIKDYDGNLSVFRYGTFDYGRLTFRDTPKSHGVYMRNLHKKGRRIKLRFENENINQPFILKGYNLEYLQM